MTGPPPLPLPPAVIPPIAPVPWTAALWRIQNGTEIVARIPCAALPLRRAVRGDPVRYACASQLGTFAEVYGDRARRLGARDGGRYLVRLVPHTPLSLVDLTDVRLLASLGLDERISIGDNYATCQAWAFALWRGLPEIAGIRRRARKARATVANVALFLDRCRDHVAISPDDARRLEGLEAIVLEAADVYNLIVKFPFR